MSLPIEYTAIIRAVDGHEGSVDLESAGWLAREDVREAQMFTLQPKVGIDLPVICVHLTPMPDGAKRELIYFSRVFGTVMTTNEELVSQDINKRDLFRLYCIGWKARVGEQFVENRLWVYPGGSVVAAFDPPYISELIEHHMYKGGTHIGEMPEPEVPTIQD